MKTTLAALIAGITLLTAVSAEAKEVISSRSIAYNPITEISNLESIDSETQDTIARRDPQKEGRIRRRIIRGVREHRRRQFRHRIIRGIIGNKICADRGGYWEDDNCYMTIKWLHHKR